MTLRVTIKPTATLMLRLAHLTIGISSAAFMIGGGAWNHAVAQHRELSKPAAAFSPKSCGHARAASSTATTSSKVWRKHRGP